MQIEHSYLWTWICDQIALHSGEFGIIQVLPVTSDRDTAGSCCFQFQNCSRSHFVVILSLNPPVSLSDSLMEP